VRSESVDVGQFAMRGTPLASLYAVDFVEVRLPLPDRELAYLDLPLSSPPLAPHEGEGRPGQGEHATGPKVLLHADFAGERYTWEGRVVRTEGEIDPKTRMVHVVARVADPYGRDASADAEQRERPPLAVGLFVEAEILGREIERATLLPRVALREGGRVYVVDAEGRLRFRDVEVLREEREQVVIGRGLRDGERVCISPLAAALDGMRVRISDAPGSLAEASP